MNIKTHATITIRAEIKHTYEQHHTSSNSNLNNNINLNKAYYEHRTSDYGRLLMVKYQHIIMFAVSVRLYIK